MLKFVVRRLLFMVLTMLIVSAIVFLLSEAVPGDVARHILGPFASPEQVALFRVKLGLDRPLLVRYAEWLLGNDWLAERRVGLELRRIENVDTGRREWWAIDTDGVPKQWTMEETGLVVHRRMPDGSVEEAPAGDVWRVGEDGRQIFWGVDTADHAVKWQKSVRQSDTAEGLAAGSLLDEGHGVQYIPLRRGLLRGDPGLSVRTNRPVSDTLFRRLENSLILAAISFVVVMPLALILGLIAGANEGRPIDRVLSLSGLVTAASPDFATGIFLVLLFAVVLDVVPGATVFVTRDAIFRNPAMLVLPVLTLTLIELGYVLRVTRASMVEVMATPYIRTAVLKGLSYREVVLHHAVPNALLAPVTVIMLHVNWLIGRIVVVEAIFGFPGLGSYLLESALFKDVNAIEAGAMLLIVLAVGTQLIADILYTFLNPRIRYE
jgi:peptide/nickel transport system permease protein